MSRNDERAGSSASGGESDSLLDVFIEVPMGSRNKYEWDFEQGRFMLDRMLFTAVRYPGDYGFVPQTLALDGDHLDALVILGEPTFPGCTVRTRVLGMLDMRDDKGPDEKVLTVADHDPRWQGLQHLEDVPEHLLDEISHFFSIYKDLEQKRVTIHGWEGRQRALDVIAQARARWPGATHEPGNYPT